jgi:hypothetical protein
MLVAVSLLLLVVPHLEWTNPLRIAHDGDNKSFTMDPSFVSTFKVSVQQNAAAGRPHIILGVGDPNQAALQLSKNERMTEGARRRQRKSRQTHHAGTEPYCV